MKATEFKSVLNDLADLFRAGGARSPANDIDILASRIDCSEGKSAEDALDQLEGELADESAAARSPSEYVQALKDAGLEEASFLNVFSRLKNDPNLKKADIIQVMRGYAGSHVRARTKAEAIDEIERRFSELVYDDRSHRQAASATPW